MIRSQFDQAPGRAIKIWAPGIPQPGGSKKGFVYFDKDAQKHRAALTEDNTKSKPWREVVGWEAKEIFRGEPLRGQPLEVTFKFILPRPKSHYGTGNRKHTIRPGAPAYPAVKPDVTKLVRSTEDALKGIAWLDDSDIVQQHAFKYYGNKPGCLITIREARPGEGDEVEEFISSGQLWMNGMEMGPAGRPMPTEMKLLGPFPVRHEEK